MGQLAVRHLDGDRYAVRVREHEVVVDQPIEDGGTDAGPTPTELWVAGLASCVAFYGGRFLVRHGIDPAGFVVTGAWAMADRPARVASIELGVQLPDGFPEAKRERFMAVVEHCTVHNSMVQMPHVQIAVVAPVAG
jgi:putative redox protein